MPILRNYSKNLHLWDEHRRHWTWHENSLRTSLCLEWYINRRYPLVILLMMMMMTSHHLRCLGDLFSKMMKTVLWTSTIWTRPMHGSPPFLFESFIEISPIESFPNADDHSYSPSPTPIINIGGEDTSPHPPHPPFKNSSFIDWLSPNIKKYRFCHCSTSSSILNGEFCCLMRIFCSERLTTT